VKDGWFAGFFVRWRQQVRHAPHAERVARPSSELNAPLWEQFIRQAQRDLQDVAGSGAEQGYVAANRLINSTNPQPEIIPSKYEPIITTTLEMLIVHIKNDTSIDAKFWTEKMTMANKAIAARALVTYFMVGTRFRDVFVLT
jgi:hypothetical protein